MKQTERIERPKVIKSIKEDYVTMRPTPKAMRKKGEFLVRIQFQGKRDRFYFKTKEEAQRFYESQRREIEQKSSNYRKGDVAYHTLGNIFRAAYKDKLDKGKIKKSTYSYIHGIFGSHLLKYENFYTHQITDEIWKEISDECRTRGCPSQPEKILGILNNLQRYLIKQDFNPMDVELDEINVSYKNKQKPKSSYSLGEYEQVYELLGQQSNLNKGTWIGANVLVVGMNTGLRIGELISLDYAEDIDLENKTITVRSTYSPQIREITSPKTLSSYRTVTFSQDAYEAIQNLIALAKEKRSRFLINGVFKRNMNLGKPICYGSCTNFLKQAMIEAKIPALNSQAAMRKTHITNLIRNAEAEGVPFIEAVTVAQKRAGHSKLTTTLDDYTKTSTEKEEKLLNSMSRTRKNKVTAKNLNELSKEELIKLLEDRSEQ